MDKENRKSRFRGVRAVPIRKCFRGGVMMAKKRKGAEGKYCEKSSERNSVEVEGVVVQIAGRQRVDEEYTL